MENALDKPSSTSSCGPHHYDARTVRCCSQAALSQICQSSASLLKHNNLMLRSERRERLEAWAASESAFAHSQYYAAVNLRAFFARAGNLLSIEKPTFSARMMVAIVSKRGLAPGASVL